MKQGRYFLSVAAAAVLAAGFAGAAHAQRDPAYEAARKAGQIGEKTDGYLGVVGSASPAIQKLADSINIQRRSAYTKAAAAIERMSLA